MKINSLEEMVKRRNSNSNEICNNTENNTCEGYRPRYYNNCYDSTSFNNQNKTIQRLEQDREKLIKDNMKLIQYNKKLKEQINNLNKIINSITMNNNNEKENNDNIDLMLMRIYRIIYFKIYRLNSKDINVLICNFKSLFI